MSSNFFFLRAIFRGETKGGARVGLDGVEVRGVLKPRNPPSVSVSEPEGSNRALLGLVPEVLGTQTSPLVDGPPAEGAAEGRGTTPLVDGTGEALASLTEAP